VVIYVNGSCSWSVTSIAGLVGVLIDRFSGVIKCTKERLTNTVVILEAWLFVKGPKAVRNTSGDPCS
jgi:hypothetical protein